MPLIVYLQYVINIFSLFCILKPPPKKKISEKRAKEFCASDIDEVLELVFLSEN